MPAGLIVLKTFIAEIDANMARDILQDDGLKAFIFKNDGGGHRASSAKGRRGSLAGTSGGR